MRPNYTAEHGLVLDITTILAFVALAITHTIPGDVAVGLLGTFMGLSAALRRGGGPGPGGAGSSAPPTSPELPPRAGLLREVSLCAALAAGLFAVVQPHHRDA